MPAFRHARLAAGAVVRRVPGGPYVLRWRRRAYASARRVVWPLRPPVEAPERIPRLAQAPEDESFITGNGIAARCRYVINFDVLKVNEHVDNNWWFCQTEFLEFFFRSVAPRDPFVLFSHNSDRAIGERERRFLRRRNLVAWFAPHVTIAHPKLFAVPLGIANPRWPHGDQAKLKRVMAAGLPKTQLFNVSYDVGTALDERLYCAQETRLTPGPPQAYEDYLRDLGSSYFCIAPRGNGVDTHRAWEALYLRTIPIVTRSGVTDQHPDFPMIVLDDWGEFRELELTPAEYESRWAAWDPQEIRLDRYLARVEARLARLRR